MYYVDGKRATKALNEDVFADVATMKILKGEQQRQALGTTTGASRAIVITTNKNHDRADVRAFTAVSGLVYTM